MGISSAATGGRGPVKMNPVRTARGPANVRGAKGPARVAKPAGVPRLSNPLLGRGGGGQLLRAARGMATAATAPAISALQQEMGQNNAQTQGAIREAGGYFNQLGDLAKQGYQDQGQIAAGLNQQLGQIGSQEQQQLQGLGQGALSSLGKYAPQSDAAGSLAAPARSALTAEIARQQGLAAQDQGAFKSFGAQQGANYRSAGASQLGTDALAGTQALGQIAQAGTVRNEPLEAKLANIRGVTYPADVETALGKLWGMQATDQIARAGLGIKGLDARASMIRAQTGVANAKTNRFKANTAARAQNPSIPGTEAWKRVQDVHSKNWANNPNAVGSAAWARVQSANAKTGKSRVLSPTQDAAASKSLGAAISAIQTWEQGGMKNGKGQVVNAHPTQQQMAQVLGSKFDPTLVQAALDVVNSNGKMTPGTYEALRAQGYRIAGWTYRGQPITVETISSGIGGAGKLAVSGIRSFLGG